MRMERELLKWANGMGRGTRQLRTQAQSIVDNWMSLRLGWGRWAVRALRGHDGARSMAQMRHSRAGGLGSLRATDGRRVGELLSGNSRSGTALGQLWRHSGSRGLENLRSNGRCRYLR